MRPLLLIEHGRDHYYGRVAWPPSREGHFQINEGSPPIHSLGPTDMLTIKGNTNNIKM